MDFIPGERVSGKIEKINSDGLVILLRDDIRGFVSQDFLEDLFNWFSRTEKKLEEIRKHRSDRLSEDYYQD